MHTKTTLVTMSSRVHKLHQALSTSFSPKHPWVEFKLPKGYVTSCIQRGGPCNFTYNLHSRKMSLPTDGSSLAWTSTANSSLIGSTLLGHCVVCGVCGVCGVWVFRWQGEHVLCVRVCTCEEVHVWVNACVRIPYKNLWLQYALLHVCCCCRLHICAAYEYMQAACEQEGTNWSCAHQDFLHISITWSIRNVYVEGSTSFLP